MSNNNYNNKNNNNNTRPNAGSGRPVYKTFCKVCQDSGKPESIYTNHNVRQSQDKNSPVTCPTLLAQECRICYQRGHSSKYCSKAQDQCLPSRPYQSQSQSQYSRPPLRAPEPKKEVPKAVVIRQIPKNVFMVFEEEEEEKQEKQAKEELIQAKEAPAPRQWTSIAPALSFSKIIAAAPALNQKDEEKKAAVAAAKAIPYKPKVIVAREREVKWEAKRLSWADADNSDYDSGDEDEDEEEETSAW
jgi:hypothetical protein